MLRTYLLTNELYYCRVRVPKDESYFVYFTLESNEGIAYFSTVDESLKAQYRDIDIKCPIELRDSLKSLLQRLQETIRLDIITEEIIQDS